MKLRNNMCDYFTRLMLVFWLLILSFAVSSGQQTSTAEPGNQITIEDVIRREVTRQIQVINNDKVKDEMLEEIRQDIDQIKKGKYKI